MVPGSAASICERWDELIAELEARQAALASEVRAYPTPIARCDAQLPGLLEDRRRVTEALAQAIELRASVARIAELASQP